MPQLNKPAPGKHQDKKASLERCLPRISVAGVVVAQVPAMLLSPFAVEVPLRSREKEMPHS